MAVRVELQPDVLIAKVEPEVAGLARRARGIESGEIGNNPGVCFDGSVAAFADRRCDGGANK